MAIGINSSAKTLGIGGRFLGTLFFGVFFLMGLGFEIMIVRQTAATLATYGWTGAEAVILSSEISPPRSNEHDPALHVRYAYTFRGARQESDRIETGSGALETSEVYRLAERYTVGTSVPCWVNPANPSEAVLQRKSWATGFVVLFPLIFVAVGGIGIWAMWRRKAQQDDATTKPISSRANNSKAGRLIMVAFFGVFLLVGCGVTYALFVGPVLKIFAARSWAQVPCEIVSSRVKTNSSSDGDTYSVDIVYRYTYQGHPYTSNRYHFITGSSSGYQGKAEVVNRFPPGKQTTCFVNPGTPVDAVLDRNATNGLWFGLIPLVFVAVGAGGVIFTLRRAPVGTGAFAGVKIASIPIGGTVLIPVAGGGDDQGPQTLKPASSPKAKLIGVICVTLFWNGIVSVFLYNLVSDWRHGAFNWFLALFLTPFVAVGLGLIGGVFYQFMALFNPRPRLTVSRGVLLPGDMVDLSWTLDGRANRLQRLQITLEGREEATYRRGTDTRTDKEAFATIQIVDTTDPVAMHSSSAKLHVPPGAMHSFKSANNKILWVLKVHGDIPRWPDIKDEYPIEVAPHPITR
jgi:hypothetical protein